MIILDMEQGSEEWLKARAGIPSASNFDKIVTTKGDSSKSNVKYMYTLAGESILGTKEETYQNATMIRGIELEAEARNFYGMLKDVDILEVGFCMNDKKEYGCSPDGMIGEDGLIEIKCPLMSTHVEYLLKGVMPSNYFQQVQGQLFVTGRKWCDFISYYPGLKPFIIRVERSESFIRSLEIELNLFCAELKQIVERIG